MVLIYIDPILILKGDSHKQFNKKPLALHPTNALQLSCLDKTILGYLKDIFI